MLFHASIPARNPAHVASVIAELWRGRAYPFPPVPGSHIAFADDGRGTTLEVYPKGQEMVPGDIEVQTRLGVASPYTETHVAIAVQLSIEEIQAVASREGWNCLICDRGGLFGVVELWIENEFLIEALTPEMQAAYLAAINPENWERTFALEPLGAM